MNFIIQTQEGDLYDLHMRDFAEALTPQNFPAERLEGWGMLRLRVNGHLMVMNDEMPGLHVSFESDVSHAEALVIVNDVLVSVERFTGIKDQLFDSNAPEFQGKPIRFD